VVFHGFFVKHVRSEGRSLHHQFFIEPRQELRLNVSRALQRTQNSFTYINNPCLKHFL